MRLSSICLISGFWVVTAKPPVFPDTFQLESQSKFSSGGRRKFSWGFFHSVAYGGHLYLVCPVCDVTIWRHIYISKPTFWRSLLT